MSISQARNHFASSIKRWRALRGLTQEALAEKASLHRTYISDIERGARNLSLESIARLALALEIPIPMLFSPAGLQELLELVARSVQLKDEFVDVLLVEDNPDDVELTLLAFEKSRFVNSVRVARDGAEALDIFFGKGDFAARIADPLQQIILLDLNLPKVNGLEVLRRLKSDKRTKDIPVIILTVSDKDRDIDACLKLGAAAYISKPVSLEGLSRVTPQLSLTWALIKPTLASDSRKTLNVR